jgi:hypothetical protein
MHQLPKLQTTDPVLLDCFEHPLAKCSAKPEKSTHPNERMDDVE